MNKTINEASIYMKYLLSATVILLASCNFTDGEIVTLYKKGLEKTERIHVATFDTSGGFEANNTSCAAIAILLETQDPMNRFWCEKGHYHKNITALQAE